MAEHAGEETAPAPEDPIENHMKSGAVPPAVVLMARVGQKLRWFIRIFVR